MKRVKFMTKTNNIVEELRCRILSGIYPQGKLPGERELASELAVGRGTVRAALQLLENEGVVERRRGAGTIVKVKCTDKKDKTAGFIMRTSGHVFDELYHSVLSVFVANGYSVQSIPTDSFVGDNKLKYGKAAAFRSAVKKMIDFSPDVIVLDGYCNARVPFRNEMWKRNTILFNFLDSAEDEPVKAANVDLTERRPRGVWFDFEAIGYMGGKYLLDCGCRRPLLVSQYIPVQSRLNHDYYSQHRERKIAAGFSKALAERGIDPICCIIDCFAQNSKQYQATLEYIFQSAANLPDGFFGSSDVITLKFIKDYLENFGKLPKDIVCVGVGNTPWSNVDSLYPFSSIDFNLESMAEEIMRMAECPVERRKDVYIKPILVER